jgi:transaldolase/glucose-6-phosphate isomerase
MSNPLKDLSNFGQSPWMDFISRPMLESGDLARMLEEDGVKGVTSNPSIFDKAISSGSDYDAGIRTALESGVSDPESVFERLAVRDIQEACDVLRPVYDQTDGVDGYVSLEVSPTLAYDTEGTAAAAERLFNEVARPNVMIKIPSTKEGLPAITETIAKGINVNVTLIFSLERYMEVMNAYLAGLEKLAKTDKPLKSVASVASFFISRIDSAIDSRLPEGSPLKGKIAIANAKTAYKLFQKVFDSKRFKELSDKGARVQRPLWASTSTKDPSYPDTLYVDTLIGKDTVNTIPPATWDAFRDHGTAGETITAGVEEAKGQLEALSGAGIDLGAVTRELEEKGVKAFADAFSGLMHHLKDKVESLRSADPGNPEGAAAPQPEKAGLVARIWNKDASVWKDEESHRSIIDNSLGWLTAPETMSGRVSELESFANEIRGADFEAAVVLGMGGSSLAPEVLRRTFPRRDGFPVLRVLDSTEPETVEAVLGASDPAKTLFIVASKSGSTTEPLRFFDYAWSKVPKGENFVAITDPGSQLEALAKEKGFRRCFLNFADIGGRFSALSYFGLVPAAAAGIDAERGEPRTRAGAMARGPARGRPRQGGPHRRRRRREPGPVARTARGREHRQGRQGRRADRGRTRSGNRLLRRRPGVRAHPPWRQPKRRRVPPEPEGQRTPGVRDRHERAHRSRSGILPLGVRDGRIGREAGHQSLRPTRRSVREGQNEGAADAAARNRNASHSSGLRLERTLRPLVLARLERRYARSLLGPREERGLRRPARLPGFRSGRHA